MASSKTDLTYLTTGLFTVFFPESEQGDDAYYHICEVVKNSSAKILTRDLKNTLHQLRKSGYIVRKAKKPKQTIDDVFNELYAY